MVVIKFRVRGDLRFLSHAETMKLFQRAFTRAGIKMRYSEGFNPRPRISLPLPRSVGIESEDDLLCVQLPAEGKVESELSGPGVCFDTEQLKAKVSGQLPEGCELVSVRVAEGKVLPRPCSAIYVLIVQHGGGITQEKLKAAVDRSMSSENLVLERQVDKRGTRRKVDVRGFLESVRLEEEDVSVCERTQVSRKTRIVVECKISSTGSIRVDEILKVLELDVGQLAGPIKRLGVKWQE